MQKYIFIVTISHGLDLNNGYVAISSPFKLSKLLAKILWDVASHLNHISKGIWGDGIGQHDPIFDFGEY